MADEYASAVPPVRDIRGLLTKVARRVRDDAALVEDWEAQSLFATTVEVLKCLDEAYERYERRHAGGSQIDDMSLSAFNQSPNRFARD